VNNELLDLYLDGIDADGRPEVILTWQRKLLKDRGKGSKRLAPNTTRLARAPLSGAWMTGGVQG
jgi:hypothetical protein